MNSLSDSIGANPGMQPSPRPSASQPRSKPGNLQDVDRTGVHRHKRFTALPGYDSLFEKLVDKIWAKVDAENRSQSRAIFEKIARRDAGSKIRYERIHFLGTA